MILGLIIVFLFSIVGFLWLGRYYTIKGEGSELTSYCDTLLYCTASTLNVGVRSGGGIGDGLHQPSNDESTYTLRMIFDIFFFIIVIVILLNIIFGIIIDTFGELRDERKRIEKEASTICFICGRSKYEFELRGSGWNQHRQIEHNVWSYLAYLISIQRK